MKETTKTSRTACYLEKMFRELNKDFFDNELVEPIITIQSTPRAYGHVTVAKVWKRKDDSRHELNIGADTLERPIENVAATMLHEMVHLFNMQKGVQDTSRGGTYHNRKFKEEAERRGLVINYNEKYGWTITSPSDELLDYIIEQGWTEIQMNRGGNFCVGGSTGTGNTDKARSSTRKYVCPVCGQSIRATKTVNLICGDCFERMIELPRA